MHSHTDVMTFYLNTLSRALAAGDLTARELTETCLEAIASEDGKRAFIEVYSDRVRVEADHIDNARQNGHALPPFAGIPLSIKDLFDVRGEVTRAGSTVMADNAAATTDAAVVSRLKAAGFILIGRTNMTEFAFSGLGMNPHYGDPRSPFERHIDGGRVAGGSSSGSAVSISDGMAPATIGSDTGGSTRTPAAFCGIVGLKPTSTRMPGDGVYPLSTSFDAAGPMSNSVDCAAIMDSIMAGGDGAAETPFPLKGLRLAMPVGYLFDGLDDAVANSFDEAVQRLSAAGAIISEISLDTLEELRPANNPKSIVAAEAFALHRDRLQSDIREGYDPFVASRINSGSDILAADYIDQFTIRRHTMRLVQQQTRFYDALAMPTSPLIPPKIETLSTIDAKMKMSGMALRNTALANFLDRPTITIPCHKQGTAPVGLSLMGSHKHDRRLLAIAAGAESAIRG
jgi:aspartyl-tRNA(Asn)/glutamyl-tRNA(Gln) amidotransferase subunit A